MQVALLHGLKRTGVRVRSISWAILALAAALLVVAMVEDLAGWWTRLEQKTLVMFYASWAPMTPFLDNFVIHQVLVDIIAGFRRASTAATRANVTCGSDRGSLARLFGSFQIGNSPKLGYCLLLRSGW
jgi:hypothetical protein